VPRGVRAAHGTVTATGLASPDLMSKMLKRRKSCRLLRHQEAYAKVSLKKYKPMAARNEDRNVSSGLL
jgi:hypothetical protein